MPKNDIIKNIEKVGKEALSLKKSNPLIQFGVAGVGAVGGIYVFNKISLMLSEKFPALTANKFFLPFLKVGSALLIYVVGSSKLLSKIPMIGYFTFGSGVGIVGNAISSWIFNKINPIVKTVPSEENLNSDESYEDSLASYENLM